MEQAKKLYDEDPREACRFGSLCYQKNPKHHEKFKHFSRKKIIEAPKNKTETKKETTKRKSPDIEEDKEDDSQHKYKKQNFTHELSPSPEKDDNNTLNAEETSPAVETKETLELQANCSTKLQDSCRTPEKTSSQIKTPEKNSELNCKQVECDGVNYDNPSDIIRLLFLTNMPDDFYKFYQFCSELNPKNPSLSLKILNLELVGPYDVLNGKINGKIANKSSYLRHWRYFYDPPEFQTIIKGDNKEGLHYGYWRDEPTEKPVFIAKNCVNVNCIIKRVSENIFGAISEHCEASLKKCTPFEKASIVSLGNKLKAFAKKNNITLETNTSGMKLREKKVVARTFHKAGIVVPYNKKTQLGYRELCVTDNQLEKTLKRINDAESDDKRKAALSEFGEVVRLTTIAGDECDFGTCLEFGHNILSSGVVHVQNAAVSMLSIAYKQLHRDAFLDIVKAHFENRQKGCNLSVI